MRKVSSFVGVSLLMAMVFSIILMNPIEALSKEWDPETPINVNITYPAGGGTDRNIRPLIAEMEKQFNTKLIPVNMPGATGAVAMDYVWRAKRDGHNWLGTATNDVLHYPVTGLHATKLGDWEWFCFSMATTVVSVGADSKYQTMQDLLDDFKNRPGEVKIASAGMGAHAHIAAEMLKLKTGINYKHVPYDGGYPAVISAVQGETDVTLENAIQVEDMLRAGKLRALAAYDLKPFNMKGYGEIPSILDTVPEMANFLPHGAHFGLAIPKDTPDEIKQKVKSAFVKTIENEKIQQFVADNGLTLVGLTGEEAEEWMMRQAPVVCWVLYEGGYAEKNPKEAAGYEKPW